MAKSKVAVLSEALDNHRQAKHEFNRLLRAVALAEQVLSLTREAVESATNAIKSEGPS